MLGLIRRLSDVWYLPHLWNVGRTKKMEACVGAMVFFMVKCSRVVYVWVFISLYHDVRPLFSFDLWLVTMYEAWIDLSVGCLMSVSSVGCQPFC